MRRVPWLIACAFLLPLPAVARCFDFTQKVVTPLRAPPPLDQGAELRDFGTTASGMAWATVRSVVPRPIQRVVQGLMDHRAEVDEVVATPVKSEHYLARQDVRFRVTPMPLITVRWTEAWAFALTQGTAAEPEELVVSYEKTEGSAFIEHMCGSIVLRKVTADATEVFWFEETKITRRSAEDASDTIAGVIKRLRQP